MQKIFKKKFYSSALLSLSISLASAQDVTITLPKVPKPVSAVKVTTVVPTNKYIKQSVNYKSNEQIVREATQDKVVNFSNHVAPKAEEIHDTADKKILVGDPKDGQVTAYLHAPLMTTDEVKTALTGAGFEILSTFKIDKKGNAESIAFTNDDLIKIASKKGRGFASSLRVTVDKKNNLISITNPIYVMHAFMQKEYDEKVANKTLEKLRGAFKNLKNSEEVLKLRTLGRYQFMAGMPKYEDTQLIKKLDVKTLLENARKSKKIVYEQKLLNGSIVLGVKLCKRTTKFIKKVGYQNAGLLPYPVLIENGEARILDPKYYIAIMYPLLKMSQFMTIATVPGAINKDIDRVFR